MNAASQRVPVKRGSGGMKSGHCSETKWYALTFQPASNPKPSWWEDNCAQWAEVAVQGANKPPREILGREPREY